MLNTVTRESSPLHEGHGLVPWRSMLAANLRRVELGDFLLLLYIAAFVRQYAWLVTNNVAAWVLTGVISLVLWYLLLTTKRIEKEKSRLFWLIVALPPLPGLCDEGGLS